ncbi:MAG: IgGFc-binding protein [Minicystis sp.]
MLPRPALLLHVGLPAGFAAFALYACSASSTNPPGWTGGSGGGSTASGTGGSPDITVGSGTGSGSGGSCDGVHCSADLHSVLDCNGNVLETCPPDLGCGDGGKCVAPCAAAVSNASTIGCEFYSVVPGPEPITRGSCFAVLLANTWTTPVTITAERAGQTLDIGGMARIPKGTGASLTYAPLTNGQLGPGELAILFLAQAPGGGLFFSQCPAGVTPGVNLDAAINGTGTGDAFHIKTTAPVVAYDIYPYGGSKSYVSSATLLVPTAAWGTNYIASDGWPEDPGTGGQPFIQIAAAEDGTSFTIAPAGASAPATYTLDAGQVMQFMQDAELAGSPITSTKPVSVWGGSSCMNIPVGKYACDSGHQQLVPVKALGHEYVAVRHRDRKQGVAETVPWTFVGAVDGTTLTYDPAPPAGAPVKLDSGEVVRFDAAGAFSVKSQDAQHPFYTSGHMTGWTNITENSFEGVGDAETVNVIPPEQWLSSYLFLTDPTYANTHLVFVRKKNKDGVFPDVQLDCFGTIGSWFPVGSAGEYQYSRFDMVAAGAPQGQCNNGAHTAKSSAPFGLTVWGWDTAVSYAYPAGMSTQPINTVVVPAVPK